MLGLNLENTTSSDFRITATARYLAYDVLTAGSELRFDGTLGSDPGVGFEFYQPIGPSPLFIAPYARRSHHGLQCHQGRRRHGAVRREPDQAGTQPRGEFRRAQRPSRRSLHGAHRHRRQGRRGRPADDVRHREGRRGQLAVRRAGQSRHPHARHVFGRATLLPVRSSGRRHRRHAHCREPASDAVVWPCQPVLEPRRAQSHFHHRRDGHVLRHRSPSDQQVLHRTPMRLGAYRSGELAGNHFYVATGGYLRRIGRLPDFLGGAVFARRLAGERRRVRQVGRREVAYQYRLRRDRRHHRRAGDALRIVRVRWPVADATSAWVASSAEALTAPGSRASHPASIRGTR